MKRHLHSLAGSFLLVCLMMAPGFANEVSYTYDQLNRLVGAEYSDGTKIEYAYDEVGNRLIRNVVLPSGPEANFTASPASGPVPLAVSFTDQSTGTIIPGHGSSVMEGAVRARTPFIHTAMPGSIR